MWQSIVLNYALNSRGNHTVRIVLGSVSAAVVYAAGSGAHAQGNKKLDAENVSEGEIIVTANRREQKLQDVPLAISSISGSAAERRGITGTAALEAAVPNLTMARQANQAQPFRRARAESG